MKCSPDRPDDAAIEALRRWLDDILIGAPYDETHGSHTGAAYLILSTDL